MPDIHCSIVLSEELDERFDGVFGGLALTHGSGTTELNGRVIDQAALNGVLKQVMDLGLEIISISTHPGGSGPGDDVAGGPRGLHQENPFLTSEG